MWLNWTRPTPNVIHGCVESLHMVGVDQTDVKCDTRTTTVTIEILRDTHEHGL